MLGLRPTAEVARARTILLELERLWNHLNDIAAVCAGVGLAAGTCASLRSPSEHANSMPQLTGHRFLFGSIAVGGNHLSFNRSTAHATNWRAIEPNPKAPGGSCSSTAPSGPSAGDRSRHARGRLALGAVGPAARASGVAEDARTDTDGARLQRLHDHRPPTRRR